MKKCQYCQLENEDSMSYCLECGTPLSTPTANFQNSPATFFKSSPTVFGNSETETLVGKKTSLGPPFQQSAPPPRKNRTFLLLGGIGALFLLLIGTAAMIVIYNLIPPADKPVTLTTTPTPLVKTPTPQVSFTPPIEPTKKGSFTVYANEGWQLSDIDVVPLEEFSTTVQGKADISGIKTGTSSSGVKDAKTKSRRIFSEFPTGALLMRTRYADGKFSNVAALTANGSNGNWRNYPDERGKIEFCINDNAPENNGGQFIVTVTLTKLPKPKK